MRGPARGAPGEAQASLRSVSGEAVGRRQRPKLQKTRTRSASSGSWADVVRSWADVVRLGSARSGSDRARMSRQSRAPSWPLGNTALPPAAARDLPYRVTTCLISKVPVHILHIYANYRPCKKCIFFAYFCILCISGIYFCIFFAYCAYFLHIAHIVCINLAQIA